MALLAHNDANIVYSPFNWNVTATSAKTINTGAYFRMMVQGSITGLTANFSAADNGRGAMRIGFRVDDGPWQDTYQAATVPVNIDHVPVNTWGYHTIEMVFIASSEGLNRWLAPQNAAVEFMGFTTDTAVTTRAIRKAPLTALLMGDSITEGVRTLSSTTSGDQNRNDVRNAWSYPMKELLGCEVGVVGFGAVGIVNGGSGSVPRFAEVAKYIYDGVPKNYMNQPPDLAILHIGTNDGSRTDADVVTYTVALINNLIDMLPTSTRIFVLSGWKDTKKSMIQSGISQSKDPSRVTFITTTGWWNSADASDALHPYGYINIYDLSPRLAGEIKSAMATPAVAPSTSKMWVSDASGNAVSVAGIKVAPAA